jgi:hypothetical protein
MQVSWCKPGFSHAPKVVMPKCRGPARRSVWPGVLPKYSRSCPLHPAAPQNGSPTRAVRLPAERSPRLAVLLGGKIDERVIMSGSIPSPALFTIGSAYRRAGE